MNSAVFDKEGPELLFDDVVALSEMIVGGLENPCCSNMNCNFGKKLISLL